MVVLLFSITTETFRALQRRVNGVNDREGGRLWRGSDGSGCLSLLSF